MNTYSYIYFLAVFSKSVTEMCPLTFLNSQSHFASQYWDGCYRKCHIVYFTFQHDTLPCKDSQFF